MSMRGSKVIFVGNIPWDLTEEQLVEIFREVGPVSNFRLMFDRETGKPRGFGFCEFADAETAESAIRNLNGVEVGGRQLRLDRADHTDVTTGGIVGPSATGHTAQQPVQSANTNAAFTNYSQTTQYGIPAPSAPSISAPIRPILPNTVPSASLEAINATLASMNNTQLIELISQLKTMSEQNPEQSRQFLAANPQLSYAIFQALLMMNLVEARLVQQIMQQQQETNELKTSAGEILASAPGPIQQRELLQQIMSLTNEQIAQLPPDQRAQISMLRDQLVRSLAQRSAT